VLLDLAKVVVQLFLNLQESIYCGQFWSRCGLGQLGMAEKCKAKTSGQNVSLDGHVTEDGFDRRTEEIANKVGHRADFGLHRSPWRIKQSSTDEPPLLSGDDDEGSLLGGEGSKSYVFG